MSIFMRCVCKTPEQAAASRQTGFLRHNITVQRDCEAALFALLQFDFASFSATCDSFSKAASALSGVKRENNNVLFKSAPGKPDVRHR